MCLRFTDDAKALAVFSSARAHALDDFAWAPGRPESLDMLAELLRVVANLVPCPGYYYTEAPGTVDATVETDVVIGDGNARALNHALHHSPDCTGVARSRGAACEACAIARSSMRRRQARVLGADVHGVESAPLNLPSTDPSSHHALRTITRAQLLERYTELRRKLKTARRTLTRHEAAAAGRPDDVEVNDDKLCKVGELDCSCSRSGAARMLSLPLCSTR